MLGWDYELNAHHALSASLVYGTRNATSEQDALATTSTALAMGRSATFSRLITRGPAMRVSLTPIPTTWRSAELSVLALYSRNGRFYRFPNDLYVASEASALGMACTDNPSANQEATVQVDYQTPLGKQQLLFCRNQIY